MPPRRPSSREIPVARITSHLLQARKQADRAEADRLAASIHEHGLLSPILVRKKGREYELVAGQRRLAACKRLGWTSIPAVILDAGDFESIQIALAENIERTPLAAMERVELLEYLAHVLPEDGLTEIAHRLGFRPEQADQVRQLARIPPILKEAINLGVVTAEHALALARLREEQTIATVLRTVHEKGLDVAQTEELVNRVARAAPSAAAASSRPPAMLELLARVDLVYRAVGRGKVLDTRVILPLVEDLVGASARPLAEFLSDQGLSAPMFPLHALRVARVAVLIARAMGMDEAEQETAALAGVLQDLGMLRVPQDVVRYEGPLSEEGRRAVRLHVDETVSILEGAGWVPSLAQQACFTHHERLDGSGYPRGVREGDVPPLARVLAVADTYAAVGESRPWRAARPPEEALRVLEKEAQQGRLDAAVVAAWAELLAKGRA